MRDAGAGERDCVEIVIGESHAQTLLPLLGIGVCDSRCGCAALDEIKDKSSTRTATPRRVENRSSSFDFDAFKSGGPVR